MTFYRPGQDTGSSRFWLALSLSTVTAAAVAVPLALTAVNVDSESNNAPIAPAEVEDLPQSPTTSQMPSIQAFVPESGARGTISVGTVEEPASSPGSTTSTVPPITIPEPTVTETTETTETPTSTQAPSTTVTTETVPTTPSTTEAVTSSTTASTEAPADEPVVGESTDTDGA